MSLKKYTYHQEFSLESGKSLPEITIGYHSYGKLNERKDNVIWVCHALTASSDATDWWEGIVGEGCVFDPNKYFIVCANILGSCYGTTGPLSTNPKTKEAYYGEFPLVTIRDMVNAHDLLRTHLGINKIEICIGGSCGGHQVLEYAIMFPDLIQKMILLVSSATETAWRKAVHATQRLAIEADNTWGDKSEKAAQKGLKAARGIGLLTYRSIDAYVNTQSDEDDTLLENYKAASYINYQGEKLIKRFNTYSYWGLTKSLDTHHIGRNRGEVASVLSKIKTQTLIISIDSDMLIPISEQKVLANYINNSVHKVISSDYGHDGFLIEKQQISACILDFD